jgi:LmbE family N-acetylglucosaminyl deacetylase/ActR/RegA family two-component response regulator
MTGDALRVLVIEDDPDSALFTRTALERGAGMVVTVATSTDEALAILRGETFDLIVSDIELPGASGLSIMPEVEQLAPGVPVIILTAHAKLDYAVGALRGGAEEFLVKPVPVATLVERAETLARQGIAQRAAMPRPRRVLAVGAHPDDVEIGAGGTLAAHHAVGDVVTILTLSGGAIGGDTAARRAESQVSADAVAARLVHLDFPDTRLVPAEGIISAIEDLIGEVDPGVIYTHSVHDRHQDHRATHQAVQVAARSVPEVMCFQSPSATVDFRPHRFINIADYLDTKLRMLAAFASQSHRDYMAEDVVVATARYWSRFGTATLAEPFEVVRSAGPLGSLASLEGHEPA